MLKKCKKFDDVLFINASEHFEKGKRQNFLLDEHIEKIIEMYQFRKEEERYSKCASMEEIEKNEYNLNISRYVSTAEPEEIIDIKQINKDLIKIEETIVKAKDTHNKFLEELGLSKLP